MRALNAWGVGGSAERGPPCIPPTPAETAHLWLTSLVCLLRISFVQLTSERLREIQNTGDCA